MVLLSRSPKWEDLGIFQAGEVFVYNVANENYGEFFESDSTGIYKYKKRHTSSKMKYITFQGCKDASGRLIL